MPLKRRREHDETRKLGNMGAALGWGRNEYRGKTFATNDKQEYHAQLLENVGAFEESKRVDRQGQIAKPHVKTKTAAVVKEANAGRNEKENRRVQGIKDGSSARRKMAWDESQKDPNEPRPVVKIDSNK